MWHYLQAIPHISVIYCISRNGSESWDRKLWRCYISDHCQREIRAIHLSWLLYQVCRIYSQSKISLHFLENINNTFLHLTYQPNMSIHKLSNDDVLFLQQTCHRTPILAKAPFILNITLYILYKNDFLHKTRHKPKWTNASHLGNVIQLARNYYSTNHTFKFNSNTFLLLKLHLLHLLKHFEH